MLHFVRMKVFSIIEIIWKGKNCTGFYPIKICVFLLFFSFCCCFILFNNSAEWQMCGGKKERELRKYDNSHNWLPRFISSWFYIWSNCVVCWYSVGNRHEPYVSFAFINISIAQQENLVETELTDLCITSQSWHLSIPYSKGHPIWSVWGICIYL